MRSLSVRSPAKINLCLDVLRKRADGYHEIRTLFERINLFDGILLAKRADGKITVSATNPAIPTDNSNLVAKAAQILKERCIPAGGVHIHIHKRIPVAAGLGGGSSDAASTLIGLNKLWGLGLSQSALQRYANALGSDVAFFVNNASFALGTGRGEKIRKLRKFKTLWHILVAPSKKLSTKEVYRAFGGCFSAKKGFKQGLKFKRMNMLTRNRDDVNMLIHALRKHDLPLAQRYMVNALEEPAVRLYPAISKIKKRLSDLGVKAYALSGSGPAVFGIVNSRKEAEALRRRLRREFARWQVFAVKTF